VIDLTRVVIVLPFQAHVSPFTTIAEDRNRQWARRMQLAATEAAIERFDRARFGFGASCVYPSANLPDLALCADWLSWLLAADDQHGEGIYGTPEAWSTARRKLEQVLNGNNASDATNPICRGLGDLCRRTLQPMSHAWQQKFTAHIREIFDGYHLESLQRLAGTPAEPDAYVEIRRYSGSVPFCIDLGEFVAHAEVPDSVSHLPAFQKLLLAANDVICWVNDIYSVNKEIARADNSNYLISLKHHQRISWRQALDTVIGRTVQRASDFVAAEQELRASLDHLRPPVEAQDAAWKNVAAMRDWMAGQIAWYQSTDRYKTFDNMQATKGLPPSYVPDLFTPPGTQAG
jgi:terpene synthase-like protein